MFVMYFGEVDSTVWRCRQTLKAGRSAQFLSAARAKHLLFIGTAARGACCVGDRRSSEELVPGRSGTNSTPDIRCTEGFVVVKLVLLPERDLV